MQFTPESSVAEGTASTVPHSRHPAPAPSHHLLRELRSDHAGETGAVFIYRGILAVSRDPAVRAFAQEHLATEQQHLRDIAVWLPRHQHSRLLPGWRVAGWLTGALPAMTSPQAVHATIAAVETFVDHHYQAQIAHLQALPPAQRPPGLLSLLQTCQADERHHRDEAAALAEATGTAPGWLLRAWCVLVGAGSAAAVGLARRV